MFRLALRNIFRQRMRTGLTLAAVALGVASLLLSGGFVADILLQLREATIRSQFGHLQVQRRAQPSQGQSASLIDDPEVVERTIDELPDVVVRARRAAFSGLISNRRGQLPMLGDGVEPDKEALIGSAISILSGRRLVGSDMFNIIVGEGLAKAMKLTVGDRVDLLITTRDGAMNTLDFGVVGIFRSLSKEYDARGIRIPIRAARELTDTDGVTTIVLLLNDTAQTQAAALRLTNTLSPHLEVKSWEDLADFYRSTAALYERQFAVLQIIILVMVVLSVANSVNMTLHERTLEFGIMRALGRTDRDVFRLALLEMSLMGALGAALGVALGAGLALAVSAHGIPMPPPPNSESGFTASIRFVPSVVAAAFGLGVLASISASLLPARRLARISIVEALRRGA